MVWLLSLHYNVSFKTHLMFCLLPLAFCAGLCLISSVPAFVLVVHVSLWVFTTVQAWSSSSFKSSGAVESVEAWSLEHSPNIELYYSWPLGYNRTEISSRLILDSGCRRKGEEFRCHQPHIVRITKSTCVLLWVPQCFVQRKCKWDGNLAFTVCVCT